jgi:hypothetical protein
MVTEDLIYGTDEYETKMEKGTFRIKELPP